MNLALVYPSFFKRAALVPVPFKDMDPEVLGARGRDDWCPAEVCARVTRKASAAPLELSISLFRLLSSGDWNYPTEVNVSPPCNCLFQHPKLPFCTAFMGLSLASSLGGIKCISTGTHLTGPTCCSCGLPPVGKGQFQLSTGSRTSPWKHSWLLPPPLPPPCSPPPYCRSNRKSSQLHLQNIICEASLILCLKSCNSL